MSKLTLLLLVLSLTGISKPVKSSEAVVMFALPFLGAIVNQSWRERNSYDHEKRTAELMQYYNNLEYIPAGGCKIVTKKVNGASFDRRACKQNDGSWKLEEGQYVTEPLEDSFLGDTLYIHQMETE